eukprot:s935_g4.t1
MCGMRKIPVARVERGNAVNSSATDSRPSSSQGEFKKYDKDESGYLTRDEIVDMLKDNGGDASLEKADAVIAAYDQNGDHKLSFMEFLLALG